MLQTLHTIYVQAESGWQSVISCRADSVIMVLLQLQALNISGTSLEGTLPDSWSKLASVSTQQAALHLTGVALLTFDFECHVHFCFQPL